MKHIRNAYRSGQEGQQPPMNGGRLQRAAHHLGRRSMEKIAALDAALETGKMRQFEGAYEAAQGPNRQVMDVLRATSQIPHQDRNSQKWGSTVVYPDHSEVNWVASLQIGADQDPSRPRKTPLAASAGALHIDSTQWGHNGYRVPVDNIHVSVSAPISPVSADGPVTTPVIGQPRSTIWFNTREYDPNTYTLDDAGDFRDQARVDISPDGTIERVGIALSNASGYTDLDPTQVTINLSEVLFQAQAAADQTTLAYREIAEGIEQPPHA